MTINLPGRPNWSLDFRYDYNEDGSIDTWAILGPRDGSRYTEYASKCPTDNFCKETGRKLALHRVLHVKTPKGNLLFSKEERAAVWSQYFARPRHATKSGGGGGN